MTTVTIAPATICAGGGHVHTSWRLGSGAIHPVVYLADELTVAPSDDEVREAVRVILAGHLLGLTRAQARLILELGISITIGTIVIGL